VITIRAVQPDAVSKASGYAKFRSRSHDTVIRVYDEAGNVIEAHKHVGDFKIRERAYHPAAF
jgi:hypothetical protein